MYVASPKKKKESIEKQKVAFTETSASNKKCKTKWTILHKKV